jgi:LacI family transcriptional regulator
MNQPKSRITLRDIARRLKVSHTTVSRALRNDPQISGPLREKIHETVRKMGYVPDPMLAALTHYRWNKTPKPISDELAWINHWPDPKRLRSFHEFDLYWTGAHEEAERCGFRLEEFVINHALTSARLEKILLARGIRGILIPPHGNFPPEWNDFHWNNFCVVRFGYSIPAPRAHIVTSDQLTDGLLAFENIWKHGYRRIGLVTTPAAMTRFPAGYLFGQMKWCPDKQLKPLVIGEVGNPEDQRRLKTWMQKNKPDAILTEIRNLRSMLAQAGYEVPRDVGLSTLSVIDGGADAGIDQNSKEIGRAAVQMLISLINHNEYGLPEVCRELLVEGRWVDGLTLPSKTRLASFAT